MQRFFSSALAAAKQNPETFAAEFKKNEANANVKEYGNYGDTLIHCLIREIPDADLPAILTILIEHQVNLESRNTVQEPSLSDAASYFKKETVNFLIEHKAQINDPIKPALCSVMILPGNELLRLDIAKTLLEHGANINIQDTFGRSPLHCATENNCLDVMRYLISHGANLFLKYSYSGDMQNITALGIAYQKYILARKCFEEEYAYTKNAKNCLNLLMHAAADYLYSQGASFTSYDEKLENHLSKFIDDLAGNFSNDYDSNESSFKLKQLLKQDVLIPVLARIKAEHEQRHTFLMGSQLSAKQQARKDPGPAIYRFFQQNNGRDLVPIIFSYAHEVMPISLSTI